MASRPISRNNRVTRFLLTGCIISNLQGRAARRGLGDSWSERQTQGPDESMVGSGERIEWMLGGEGQGACPQEVPSAIEVARSSMREAKLGRQKARVMRSYT
jgi:hypothetical protein